MKDNNYIIYIYIEPKKTIGNLYSFTYITIRNRGVYGFVI